MKFKQIVLFGICAFRFCSWEVQAMTPETVPIRYNIQDLFYFCNKKIDL